MTDESPEDRLQGFIDRFAPEIAALGRDVLARMRARLPNAIQLVYDNYNGLVIGFGPSERPSDAIFSVVLYARSVGLAFLQGAALTEDPHGLLQGAGTVARHIPLPDPALLDTPAVQALIAHALDRAKEPMDPTQPGRLIIQSVSAKQRPRRPG
jgi:hypothetical protein